jgi:hypothetical protein
MGKTGLFSELWKPNLYWIMGGDDYKIHKLCQRRLMPEATKTDSMQQRDSGQANDESPGSMDDGGATISIPPRASRAVNGTLTLLLPSLQPSKYVFLHVHPPEARQLALAMDSLPWTPIQWAMHRGMQDILVAFGKSTMDRYRIPLAETLRSAVQERAGKLTEKNWQAKFFETVMAENVYCAIMAGKGGSGDTVRAVTAIARELSGWQEPETRLDQTAFWVHNALGLLEIADGEASCERCHRGSESVLLPDNSPRPGMHSQHGMVPPLAPLPVDTVLALTKFFVLERSHDFDYRIYHEFPVEMLIR